MSLIREKTRKEINGKSSRKPKLLSLEEEEEEKKEQLFDLKKKNVLSLLKNILGRGFTLQKKKDISIFTSLVTLYIRKIKKKLGKIYAANSLRKVCYS